MQKKKIAALFLTTALVFSLLPSNLVMANPDETILSVEEADSEGILPVVEEDQPNSESGSQDAEAAPSDSDGSSQDTEAAQTDSEEEATDKTLPEDDSKKENDQSEIAEEEVTIESETEEVEDLALSAGTNQISLLSSDEGGTTRTLTLTNPEKKYADMRVAVWTSEGGQDDLRWYKLSKQKDGSWKADIDLTLLKHSGKTYFHVYTGSNTFLGGIKEIFTEDDISKYPYTIKENGDSRIVTINTSVSHTDMRIAVWSEENGQDDLKWYDLTKQKDGSWKGEFSVSALKHDGEINIHLYTGYNSKAICLREITVTIVKEELKVKEITLSDSGAKRSLQVTTTNAACSEMSVAVWSKTNDQDDLKWYKLSQSDSNAAVWKTSIYLLNLKHAGTVYLHVYTKNNVFLGSKTITITEEDLKELDLKTASKDYQTTLTMTPGKTYSKMKAAIWSDENGQDDLKWYTMTEQSDGSWKTTIENSSLKHSGTIVVHFYSGSTFLGEKKFEVKEEDIPRNSVQITGSDGSRTITVTTSKTLSNMRVAVWSETKGQDDLKWYTMKQKSPNVWTVTIKTSNLRHSGICNAHVYTDATTQLGAETFTVAESEIPKNQLTITGSGASREIRLSNLASDYTSVTAAVWSEISGQDDLEWLNLKKDSDGSWVLSYPISKLSHSRNCYVHIYTTGNKLLATGNFYVSDADYFKGLLSYGNDSNIDFVQCAINIARNNDIGYGHTWPATISCAGLVGLSLTYCGYGDFIQNDPKNWGYIDLGPEYVQELMRIGCTMMMGPWSKKNISQLKPGDILYTYVDDSNNHVGIYLGNGLTVEARGPSGADDTDSNGREIAIYDITAEPTSFQVVYRLNSLHSIRNT